MLFLLQAISGWGSVLRRYYNKLDHYRKSDFTNNYLSYWSDNGMYSFFSVYVSVCAYVCVFVFMSVFLCLCAYILSPGNVPHKSILALSLVLFYASNEVNFPFSSSLSQINDLDMKNCGCLFPV